MLLLRMRNGFLDGGGRTMKSFEEAMVGAGAASGGASEEVLAVLRRFWGFEGLRPLQLEAIQAGLERRDCAGRDADRGRQVAVLPGAARSLDAPSWSRR